MDYFPKDFLLFVDESHVTLPAGQGACMQEMRLGKKA